MPRRSFIPTVVAILAVALVGLLIYGVVHGGDDTTLDDAVSDGRRPAAPAATIAAPLLDGSGTRTLASYRGKILVLNFWASWCEPCQRETPRLQKTFEKLQADGAGVVLGATYEDASDASKAFERKYGITYPSLRDIGTKIAKRYGTRALPETFVIDGNGRVVALHRGEVDQEFLDKAIARAKASTAGTL